MTQGEFRKIFDECAHYQGNGNRTFTESERDELERQIRNFMGAGITEEKLFQALFKTERKLSIQDRAMAILEYCTGKTK